MDRNTLVYVLDLIMGIVFLISFVSGLLKFTLILRLTGLSSLVIPSALISDIHDWSGILLGCCVVLHLYMNRRWIREMTGKTLANFRQEP
jgi:hypothetical protein